MFSQNVEEGFCPVFAVLRGCEAIAVTTSSVVIDLSARTNIWTAMLRGHLITADADGADIYYAFTDANSGSIDQTNTTAGNATQCARIPAGALVPGRTVKFGLQDVNGTAGDFGQRTNAGRCQFLIVRAGVASTLRLYVSSQAPSASRVA